MGIPSKIITAICISVFAPLSHAQLGTAPEDLGGDKDRKPAEIRGTVQARPVALFFAGLDSNRDKAVSQAELMAGIDADWKALKPSVTGKVGAFKIEDWALSTLGSREAYPTRLSFDSNLDNQVSEDEFRDRLMRTFDDMDTDENGRLTREELIYIAAPRIVRKEARRSSRVYDDRGQGAERQRRN